MMDTLLVTFDGAKYELLYPGFHYLVQHDDFAVQCFLDHTNTNKFGLSVCLNMIQINWDNETWILSEDYAVTAKDGTAINLPYISNTAEMKRTEQHVVVSLPNGVTVAWDGYNTVFVQLPKSFKNKVQGKFRNKIMMIK